MIIKLINDDGIWIPTPKLFFNIFNKTGLELASENDREHITKSLDTELETEHDVWFFNIKLRFNVLNSSGKSVPCNVRIIKNRKNDGCTSCITIATESDKVNIKDFDFNFTKEDM